MPVVLQESERFCRFWSNYRRDSWTHTVWDKFLLKLVCVSRGCGRYYKNHPYKPQCHQEVFAVNEDTRWQSALNWSKMFKTQNSRKPLHQNSVSLKLIYGLQFLINYLTVTKVRRLASKDHQKIVLHILT